MSKNNLAPTHAMPSLLAFEVRLYQQLEDINSISLFNNKIFTVGGSKKSHTSLRQLTHICEKITNNKIKFDKVAKTSIYDIPYFVTSNNLVTKTYGWKPKRNILKVVSDTFLWLKNNEPIINKYF